MSGRSLTAFLTLCAIWGTTWLAIKFVVREMPPLSSVGLRFVAATLVLAGYARWRGQSLSWERLEAQERWLLVWLSLLMIAIPYGLVFYGEQFISSALTAILFSIHSAFVLVFDSIRTRRSQFHRTRVLGLGLAFAGILVIFLPRLTGPPAELRGAAAILAAAAASAMGTVLAKGRAHNLDPVVNVTWQMAGGALLLLGLGATLERPALSGYSASAYGALGYLAVFGSCVTFVLYYRLLKEMAPVELSTLAFITPMVAVLVGWLVLDELLTAASFVGAGMVLTGVALLHRRGTAPRLVAAGD